MKKLKKLKLEALSNMLSRDQMKKIVGGYGPCTGYAGGCAQGQPCCNGTHCGWDPFYQGLVCH